MSYDHAQTQQTPPGPAAQGPQVRSNGLATAGFVLGLLGLLISWIPVLNIIGILLGIVGAVLAAIGLARAKSTGSGRGLAIAGLVLGVLAVLLAIVINVSFVGAVDDALETDDGPSSTVDASGKADEKPSGSSSDSGEEYTFVNGVLTTEDVKIVITDHEVIPAGQGINEYGDKPVINFTYDVTNVSGARTDASSAWIFAITAYQDNDPNSENELELGFTSSSRYSDTSMENIKKGGTVTNEMSYELDDLKTPVDLVASELLGDELGTVTYELR